MKFAGRKKNYIIRHFGNVFLFVQKQIDETIINY